MLNDGQKRRIYEYVLERKGKGKGSPYGENLPEGKGYSRKDGNAAWGGVTRASADTP